MLQKAATYISRKQAGWKSDLFKEPQQRWHFLLLLAGSVIAIYFGVSDYPAAPDIKDTAFMLVGVCGGIAGLLASVAEILPKSQTQLAGILRIWAFLAFLAVLCTFPAMVLAILLAAWLY
ncbi:hypothetical protein BH24ACT22_BH24ACT22_21020 [soil metagenome]